MALARSRTGISNQTTAMTSTVEDWIHLGRRNGPPARRKRSAPSRSRGRWPGSARTERHDAAQRPSPSRYLFGPVTSLRSRANAVTVTDETLGLQRLHSIACSTQSCSSIPESCSATKSVSVALERSSQKNTITTDEKCSTQACHVLSGSRCGNGELCSSTSTCHSGSLQSGVTTYAAGLPALSRPIAQRASLSTSFLTTSGLPSKKPPVVRLIFTLRIATPRPSPRSNRCVMRVSPLMLLIQLRTGQGYCSATFIGRCCAPGPITPWAISSYPRNPRSHYFHVYSHNPPTDRPARLPQSRTQLGIQARRFPTHTAEPPPAAR